jgi:3-oxoacyl-[acyl-carrier-protein] synthase-1
MEENEWNNMIYVAGDGIISPLGFNSADTFSRVMELSADSSKESEGRLYQSHFGIPEPFFASLIDDKKLDNAFSAFSDTKFRYTKLEKAAILSADQAISKSGIDPASKDVLFILSTTKGNVSLLEDLDGFEPERIHLWRSAELIAGFFGNTNEPLVVSNACISGCSALITGMRQLRQGRYSHIVVVGADMLCKFIISGFQSFKALSNELCRPFDKNRKGLNLGEAAATMVLSTADEAPQGSFVLEAGAMHNDANHISGPSRTAEGLLRCLTEILTEDEKEDLAFINAHGTSTLYNDDMESIAIDRAFLQDIPVDSLKGYFGHTLGAAGILESIISSYAVREQVVLRSRGTLELGTVRKLNVSVNQGVTNGKHSFVKMLSGFGGSNAAILIKMK